MGRGRCHGKKGGGVSGSQISPALPSYVSMFETFRHFIYFFKKLKLLLVVGNGDNEENWMSPSLLANAS